MKIIEFIKNHPILCVATLGFALIGYMGNHLVRWIIEKCHTSKKVEDLANKIFSFIPPEISPATISVGQGEYIVFHNGEKKEVSYETFERAYKVFQEHSPAVVLTGKISSEECANRYQLIKDKIKAIDPTLEIAFIPRTLYELVFLVKIINEEVKKGKLCPYQYKIQRNELNIDKKCWHKCYFLDEGSNENPEVKNIAFRLNNTILKQFSPTSQGFTFKELSAFAELKIDFLKKQYREGSVEMQNYKPGDKCNLCNCTYPSPTSSFRYESFRGSMKPMGIRDDKDAQIIRNALALDCSKVAQEAFLLFRGANFPTDSVTDWKRKDTPFSISYGSSLFAGSVHDVGATPFHLMTRGTRNNENVHAYVIPVLFKKAAESPFYIPKTNTIPQLFGCGEIFHARTKAWKDYDLEYISGIDGGHNYDKREHLRSNLTKQEMESQFQTYKANAFHLKTI